MTTVSTLSQQALEFLEKNKARRIPWRLTPWLARYARRSTESRMLPVRDGLMDRLAPTVQIQEMDGVKVVTVTPRHHDPETSKGAYAVYIHGGAYMLGNAFDVTAILMAEALALPVHSIEYSLTPEVAYPVAAEEALRAWNAIIAQHGEQAVLFGVSAGGGLALSLLQRLIEGRHALPKALGLFTPWTDLTGTGDSYQANEGRDPVIRWGGQLAKAAAAYARGHDPKTPGISPVYADFSADFPPTIITSGTRDLFLSDCTRLYWRLRKAMAPVELRIWEGVWHAFLVEPEVPEGAECRAEVASFLRTQLDLDGVSQGC